MIKTATELALLVMEDVLSHRHVLSWPTIDRAMHVLLLSEDQRAEDVLLRALQFGGDLHDSADPIPRTMSPLDSMRLLAAQAVVRKTGLRHEDAIEKTAATCGSPVLAGMIRQLVKEKKGG
jgi:hypothetical protein